MSADQPGTAAQKLGDFLYLIAFIISQVNYLAVFGGEKPDLFQQGSVFQLWCFHRQMEALLQRGPVSKPGALLPVFALVDGKPYDPCPFLSLVGKCALIRQQLLSLRNHPL